MATAKKKPVTAVEAPVKEAAIQEAAPVAAASAAVEAPKAEKTATRVCKSKTAAEAPAKAAPAEKKTAAKRTTTKKAAAPTVNVVVQIMGKDATPEDMVARAKADWEAQGRSVDEIKTLSVYLNTCEGRVYYVVNNDFNSGSFAF